MRVYLHVHRDDRPGKCYWLCCATEGDTSLLGLHPDFAMAEPVDAREVLRIGKALVNQFGVPMSFVELPVNQTELIPAGMRELLNIKAG